MNKKIISFILLTFLSTIILLLLSIFLYKLNLCELIFKDILFIFSIITILIGLSISIKGNYNGGSIQGLGAMNAQYKSTADLQLLAKEESRRKPLEIDFSYKFLAFTLSGIICFCITFFI